MTAVSSPIKRLYRNKFVRFGAAGVFTYFLNIGITFLLTEIVGLYYLYSYIIAWSIIIIINFILNLRFIFSVKGYTARRFIKYVLFWAVFTVTNIYLVKLFTEVLGLYYLLSITTITGVLFVVKYFTYKNLVFHKEDASVFTKIKDGK